MALLHPHPALKAAAPKADDRWLDRRRLVPLWCLPPSEYRLDRGRRPATRARARSRPRASMTIIPSSCRRVGRRLGRSGGVRPAALLGPVRLAFPPMTPIGMGQALDKLLAANPSNVPTMWEHGLWDQEDMYGTITAWEALKARASWGNKFLVMGPWRHSQANYDGSSLGDFKGTAIPRRSGARNIFPLLRPVSARRPAALHPAPGADLQYRRESLGQAGQLAAGLRVGLRGAAQAALSPGQWGGWGSSRRHRAAIPMSPIPPSRGCRICRAGDFRRWPLGRMAGQRPARRRRAGPT